MILTVLTAAVVACAGCPERLPNLRATLYYTALESDYPPGREAVFRDAKGRKLARASREFLAAASVEGSARFGNGLVLNHHVPVDGEMRWIVSDSEAGLDARGCPLVPFRTAAVDPEVVPLGTVLDVPATRGMLLPDGTRHDGNWVAGDTGVSIKGGRIDLYGGDGEASMQVARDHGIGHLEPLAVEVVGFEEGCGS